MNDFLRLVQESGIIKQIRSLVPKDKLDDFDDAVKKMIASGNQTYLANQGHLSTYKKEEVQDVERVNDKSSSEQGRDDNSDN